MAKNYRVYAASVSSDEIAVFPKKIDLELNKSQILQMPTCNLGTWFSHNASKGRHQKAAGKFHQNRASEK